MPATLLLGIALVALILVLKVFKTVEGKKNNDKKDNDKKDNDKKDNDKKDNDKKDKDKKDKDKKDKDKKDKDKKDKDKKDKDKKDKDKKDKDKKDKDKKKKNKKKDDAPGNSPTGVSVSSVQPYDAGNYTVFPEKRAAGFNAYWNATNTGDNCSNICDSNADCTGYLTSNGFCYFLLTKNLSDNLYPGSSDAYVKKNVFSAPAAVTASYVKKPDVNYPNDNLLTQTAPSTVDNCQKACNSDPMCKGFTFANDSSSMCTTKSLFENEYSYLGVDAYAKTV